MASENRASEYAEKLRSLSFVAMKTPNKKTVDVHDHHVVEVTTADERQDVTVKAPVIRLSQGESRG